MDKLKFLDGTIIDIEEGASLAEVTHIASNEANALFVCGKITPENVSTLQFLHGEAVTGDYQNVVIAAPTTREDGEEGAVIVRMHFREKNELELRVDALEVSQEVQDGAIEDLGLVVSDIAEG
ncbi:MAG: hypothetical protein IJ906_13205 [Oscillospiraceae bacterium]|nr:hypothetical protein [Oscillospiraceae bacterium]